MNWGGLTVVLSFAGLLISTVSFYFSARGSKRFHSLALRSYSYFVLFTILASGYLFYLFIANDYSYEYVFGYSSSDLSVFYKISAFWGGQEGTYLLWLLCLSLMGYYIIKRGRQYTQWAMLFYGIIGLFFALILIVLSPFEKLPVPQAEGAGLNPLLQDPWMVVHPPVIFLGYAVAAIPAAVVLAALVRKDFKDWLKVSFAPVVFGVLALGAGNIMGGFWAYKTLGWGGYWAWDPVENSSLIPWLTGLALMHGMIIERSGEALRRTNLFLAIVTFLLVIYGTFLTRSGVLADFSVHSFIDLGTNIYLVGFMIGFTLLSLAIYLVRTRRMTPPPVNLAVTSQETALLVGVWLLLLIAAVVLVGTSWPLITTFFGEPGTVDTAVYTQLTFPIAVIIAMFVGVSPFMLRKGGEGRKLLRKSIILIILSILAAVIAAALGVGHYSYLIFIFAASLAFLGNGAAFLKELPGRFGLVGARIAHLGLALMLIGILGSSAYSENEKITLDRGDAGQVFDMQVSYRGTQGDINNSNSEILLSVGDGEDFYEARPKWYWSERQQGYMRKPFIKRHLFYDIYLAPEQIQQLPGQNGIEIARGEEVKLGDYQVTFTGFEQTDHASGGHTRFGAVLEFRSDGWIDTVIPALAFGQQNHLVSLDTAIIRGRDTLDVRLVRIFADRGAILLSVEGLTPDMPPDRLILEVSKKPTMNLLWGGATLLVVGTLVSFRRRWKAAAAGASS